MRECFPHPCGYFQAFGRMHVTAGKRPFHVRLALILGLGYRDKTEVNDPIRL
jgi:hypothetical protein